MAIIVSSYTIVKPRAMVVKDRATSVTHGTMLGSLANKHIANTAKELERFT